MQAGLLGGLLYDRNDHAFALDIGYWLALWETAQMWTQDHQAAEIQAVADHAALRVTRSFEGRGISYTLSSRRESQFARERLRDEVLDMVRRTGSTLHRAFALVASAFARLSILDGQNSYPEQQKRLVNALAKRDLENITTTSNLALDTETLHLRFTQISSHVPENLEAFLLEAQKHIQVLLVTADPQDQIALRLDEEHRMIEHALRSSAHNSAFTVNRLPNARPDELNPAIRRHRPSILHFIGHGAAAGLCFVDESGNTQLADPEALGQIIGLASQMFGLRIVFMNACFSELQAQHMANAVGHVVALKGSVGDQAAIHFSREFYAALGDGLGVKDAFAVASSGAGLYGAAAGRLEPVLLERDEIMLSLLEMGFTRSESSRALLASGGGGIDEAVQWLEENATEGAAQVELPL